LELLIGLSTYGENEQVQRCATTQNIRMRIGFSVLQEPTSYLISDSAPEHGAGGDMARAFAGVSIF
jgi:hypothetical protein